MEILLTLLMCAAVIGLGFAIHLRRRAQSGHSVCAGSIFFGIVAFLAAGFAMADAADFRTAGAIHDFLASLPHVEFFLAVLLGAQILYGSFMAAIFGAMEKEGALAVPAFLSGGLLSGVLLSWVPGLPIGLLLFSIAVCAMLSVTASCAVLSRAASKIPTAGAR